MKTDFPLKVQKTSTNYDVKKKTVSTKEYISAGREATSLTYKFICRKRPIDSEMYVVFDERIFDIKHIHEFEDDMFIEITATVRE
ncbi:phage head completion protein [Bacillus cereus]